MSEHLVDEIVLEPERYELLEEGFSFPFPSLARRANETCLRPMQRRRFFQIAGSGVVVALVLSDASLREARGQGRGRLGGGAMPREIGAWLHIGKDNAITVYTGKVELGQNIRTSLTQVVAEELHVPVRRIRLVMADTDLVPFDAGTFGSRTTPAMAAQLRRVAAAAREVLFDLAAERGQVERNTLRVEEGRIVGPRLRYEFGELTRGERLLKLIDERASTTPAAKWSVAGTSVAKVDGRAFVTGGHRYASDITRPRMLFGKVLRAPALKSQLVSVDTKPASAMAGVTVVREGDFVGVAAATEHAAERALAAIRAEWKTPSQPSSDELFKYLKEHPAAGRGGGGFGGGAGSNRGSVADGLRAADQRVQAAYTIAYIAHAPLEPRAAVAEWTDGKLTVWTGTQRPFGVRDELTRALQVPATRVRIIVPDTGSGYGGKHTGEAAIEAARLARAAGRPVKVVWTRAEEFHWAYFRPAGLIEINAGVAKSGRLTAWEFHNYNSGASALNTPYDVPNERSAFHAADSPLRQGSYRALAATANHFARECHMDDLAHALKMDPLSFRLGNLKEARLRVVLEAAAQRFGWGKMKPAAGHGFGLALGTEKGSYVATCAEVAVNRTSGQVKVTRAVTAFECGAIVNPEHLKNQIEGAVVMGLGGALFEGIRFANGRILNPRFSSYRVPRFADVPVLETVLVDRKDLPSAGAGETPIVTIAPAVRNAIAQATGQRLRALPLVPQGLKNG
jgi:nicotinate dehydrogenase subunit B